MALRLVRLQQVTSGDGLQQQAGDQQLPPAEIHGVGTHGLQFIQGLARIVGGQQQARSCQCRQCRDLRLKSGRITVPQGHFIQP
ncbi:hypothetical protein D3C80_2087780 [compost metagenome]